MITSLNNASSVPISTQIITRAGEEAQKNVVPGQSNPELITPENVNSTANNVQDGVNQAQADQQARRDNAREAAVSVAEVNTQKATVEAYVEQSTGQEIDNNNQIDLNNVVDVAKRQKQVSIYEQLAEQRQQREGLAAKIEDGVSPEKPQLFSVSV